MLNSTTHGTLCIGLALHRGRVLSSLPEFLMGDMMIHNGDFFTHQCSIYGIHGHLKHHRGITLAANVFGNYKRALQSIILYTTFLLSSDESTNNFFRSGNLLWDRDFSERRCVYAPGRLFTLFPSVSVVLIEEGFLKHHDSGFFLFLPFIIISRGEEIPISKRILFLFTSTSFHIFVNTS